MKKLISSRLGVRTAQGVATQPGGRGATLPIEPSEPLETATAAAAAAALRQVSNPASSDPMQSPSAFSMPLATGDVIAGKYRVQSLIGVGGVGFVVAATHVGLDDSVALKFLKPEFATHDEAVRRFTTEARASFKIKNEHVARVLDVDTLPDGTPFIVMELLEGSDLRTLLESQQVLPVVVAVDYVLQACEALAAAHACGIVHRDIKPENLFVTHVGDDDHIKVLDFGISKVALTAQTAAARKTRSTALTMMAVGTPPYMSPEQVRASSTLDARADIWSLGCVLYELLTGYAPFERMSLMQACAAVLEEEPLPLREGCPDAPAALEAVVASCLCKDPDGRFPDIAQLALALAPFAGRSAQSASRCVELLAEGLRRSDPELRQSDPPPRFDPLGQRPLARASHMGSVTAAHARRAPHASLVPPARSPSLMGPARMVSRSSIVPRTTAYPPLPPRASSLLSSPAAALTTAQRPWPAAPLERSPTHASLPGQPSIRPTGTTRAAVQASLRTEVDDPSESVDRTERESHEAHIAVRTTAAEREPLDRSVFDEEVAVPRRRKQSGVILAVAALTVLSTTYAVVRYMATNEAASGPLRRNVPPRAGPSIVAPQPPPEPYAPPAAAAAPAENTLVSVPSEPPSGRVEPNPASRDSSPAKAVPAATAPAAKLRPVRKPALNKATARADEPDVGY